MESYYTSNTGKIYFRLVGQGHCVVFLHGYLEDLDIWNGFADELAKTYQILLIDIPGHGKSEFNSPISTFEQMSDSLNSLLIHLNIPKVSVIGHSMGGYLALAFAELFPDKVESLCLFHSTPNSDSLDKKKERVNDIEWVKKGNKKLIVERGVPLRFADSNLIPLNKEVDQAKEMALNISNDGFISALNAMVMRPDRNIVLENAAFPTQMIFGVKDNLIPLVVARELEFRHKKTRTVYLVNSGHMGFIEERDQALNAINSFLAEVFS